jgi:FixJ family two-component response regulator
MSPHGEDNAPIVVVIDDDRNVREAICGLFQSVGLTTRNFGSVAEFLASDNRQRIGCIVLDIRLPGTSGLEFLELPQADIPPSVVLISAHVDVQMAVRAMKAGAVDVFTKPVREQDLLEAVNRALALDKQKRQEAERSALTRNKYETLTEREREILLLVVAGLLNKQIAAQVGITEATVKLHRGQAMRKMGASSVPELLRMLDLLADRVAAPR